jgi:hypothetical protein
MTWIMMVIWIHGYKSHIFFHACNNYEFINFLIYPHLPCMYGWKCDWVATLGTPSKNGKEQKLAKEYSWALPLNICTTIDYYFLMFIHCISKYMAFCFPWNKNRWKSLQFCIPNCCGPFRNHVLELNSLNYNYSINYQIKKSSKIPCKAFMKYI